MIIPRCKPIVPGAKACRTKSGSRGCQASCGSHPKIGKCFQDPPCPSSSTIAKNSSGIPKGCQDDASKKDTDTRKLCQKVAEIVAQEVPCERIDQEFLEELQTKCKRYWDLLIENSIYLDENAVYEELTSKLRSWVRENHEALENGGEQSGRSDETNADDDYSDNFEEDYEEDDVYERITKFPIDLTASESQTFDDDE